RKDFFEEDADRIMDFLNSSKNRKLAARYLTPEGEHQCFKLEEQFNSLRAIAKHQTLPDTADPTLFSQLNSKDPEERKKGMEIGFKVFGKASDLKQEIHRIHEQYLAELQQIKITTTTEQS